MQPVKLTSPSFLTQQHALLPAHPLHSLVPCASKTKGDPAAAESATVNTDLDLSSSMDAPSTSNTTNAAAGADGAHIGAKQHLTPANTAAASVLTSSPDRRPISPSPPPPPPPAYEAALSMPLSPKRNLRGAVSSAVDGLNPAATAGSSATGASGAAATPDKPTTAVGTGSIRVAPSPPPSYKSWKASSPKPRATTASPPGAGGGAPASTGGVPLAPPTPPPYEAIFSPEADRTSAAEGEQKSAAEGGSEASRATTTAADPPHEAASNMIQDAAEDVAETVAGVFQAIGGVFGGGRARKDGPDVAAATTVGKGSFVADVEADGLDKDNGDDGTSRQPGSTGAANLDQGDCLLVYGTGWDP